MMPCPTGGVMYIEMRLRHGERPAQMADVDGVGRIERYGHSLPSQFSHEIRVWFR